MPNFFSGKAIALAGILLAGTGLSSCTSVSAGPTAGRPADTRPNILLIVADDMAFSDLGAFGGEIDTPNLDRLALAGVRLTDYHASPSCSPTRAMLLTGRDHHQVGLGTMAEMIEPSQKGRPGYEGVLQPGLPTMASCLGEAGYYSVMSGKWHLGASAENNPRGIGFQKSFALLEGAADHFGKYQGASWSWAGAGISSTYMEDGEDTNFPTGSYSTDYYTDKMISYLQSPGRGERPFFAYLAYTAPHWPLQAPDDIIDKYRGHYDKGPDDLAERRLQRMKELGLIRADIKPHPMLGIEPWNKLTQEQRAIEARKMEVYAAMVDRLDQNVGRVLNVLEQSGDLRNTLIIFMSDNGPDGFNGPPSVRKPEVVKRLGVENGLDNLGKPNSFFSYGAGWAQASSAPSYLFKGYTTQGGTRVPAFVTGPGVRSGLISPALTHVTDIFPTLVSLAGGPERCRNAALEGRSLRPLLEGKVTAVRGSGDVIGEELGFGRSLRQGSWKIVALPPPNAFINFGPKDHGWRLYNVEDDPGETQDLSKAHPEIYERMIALWDAYARKNGVVPPPQ